MIVPRNKRILILAALGLLVGVVFWIWTSSNNRSDLSEAGPKPGLGLMTTLPIYWSEAESIDEMLQGGDEKHWARTALEQDYRLLPLDTLAEGGGLEELDYLLLAQPRALSPQENVALDEWVRGGGKLLLFADPLLTGESRFHLGDRRRPLDIALLSPILKRWGLVLELDEAQDGAERIIQAESFSIPVQLAGRWSVSPEDQDCELAAKALVASCTVGDGQVLAVADAAMLELGHHASEHSDSLRDLTHLAFDSK